MEKQAQNDVIQEDFIDCYSNLTLKSVVMLKLFTFCSKCKYLLKADEDVLINVNKIVGMLSVKSNIKNLLTGRLLSYEKPVRRFGRKWFSPRYMYPEKTYPNFVAGPAYLMSLDVAKKLYEKALTIPLFHLEDVFITGICARKARIQPINNKLFVDYSVAIRNWFKMLSIHGVNLIKLRQMKSDFDPVRCIIINRKLRNPSKWNTLHLKLTDNRK
ncbi:Galactosyl T domain containing protein [Asbolus verrucosus]|uniref:Hexosyltransferase n=1 Tax=Asbolus verrucosus TaxID=1661398 RepID=A0A482VHD8_ASBVE|nr:Galactosyl T domain containing protein [Asbolus verrucosus]